MNRRSRVAGLAALFGCIAVADLVLGPLLIRLGQPPMVGFGLIFPLGAILALLGVVLGLFGLFLTRSGTGLAGRGRALLGLATGGAFLLVLGAVNAQHLGAPPINDITTDLDDPPAFRSALSDPANAGRDMSYPADFAPIVREAYPDLAPIRLGLPPDEALGRVREAARRLGWEVVEVRPERGELEARQTTAVFRFVDDIAVRVRPAEGGSVVDVRSKSRDGRGDLGANAERIRALRDELT